MEPSTPDEVDEISEYFEEPVRFLEFDEERPVYWMSVINNILE